MPKTTKEDHPLDGKMKQIQERAILRALILTKGNRTLAARKLGISVRTITFWFQRSKTLRKAFPKKHNQWDDFIPNGLTERDGQTSFIRKGP